MNKGNTVSVAAALTVGAAIGFILKKRLDLENKILALEKEFFQTELSYNLVDYQRKGILLVMDSKKFIRDVQYHENWRKLHSKFLSFTRENESNTRKLSEIRKKMSLLKKKTESEDAKAQFPFKL